MRCVRDASVEAFAEAVLPWLAKDQVRNTVAYTVVDAAASGLSTVPEDAVWLRVLDASGGLAGVAIRTPPFPLALSVMPPAAAETVAAYVVAAGLEPPALSGLVSSAEPFLAAWRRLGRTATPGHAMRLYRLDTVTFPTGVPGGPRVATVADLDLVAEWGAAFDRDTGIHGRMSDEERRRRVERGRFWLWENSGAPVSLAARTPPAGGVPRIGFVYTPEASRRRGYAGALVAALSADTLASGATACCLFTDLANPTSNHIYQEVGYYPVGDAGEWSLG